MDIKSHIPVAENWPRPGVNFLDVTGILVRPRVFNQVTNQLSMLARRCQATSIVAIESRGFVFASPVAKGLGLPLILARKPNKLPGPVYHVDYETEYSQDRLCVHQDSPVGQRPCIIDDVVATGGTLLAISRLLRDHYPVTEVSAVCVIGLDFLPGQELLRDAHVPIHVLTHYE